MRNILYVTIIGSFCFTISCANKAKNTDTAEVFIPTTPIVEPVTEVAPEKDSFQKTSSHEYECTVNGDKRIISINKTDSKCTVDYTKSGDTSEVAWGQSTPEICTNVLDLSLIHI